MATLHEQLDAMLTLKSNWDGYNADPIDPKPVALAKDFVVYLQMIERHRQVNRGLSVHPTRVGGVQIEWADAKADYELEIDPDGMIGVLRVDRATGQMVERSFAPPAQPQVISLGLLPFLAEHLGDYREAA
jgi:hypothetical protein